MTEVEHNVSWSSVEEHVVYADMEYTDHKDLRGLPTIVVETNEFDGSHSDAPIVIYPNDPSVVGAEEVVMEEQPCDSQWSLPPDAEEEVEISASAGQDDVDDSEIPLNDQSYATFHPFPCDFCCRRFKKKANLINHMVAHQTQRPHFCTICAASFMRKCDLVNHQKIHSYAPNRVNRGRYTQEAKEITIVRKARRRPSMCSPRRQRSSPERSPSPLSPSSQNFKPSSYVDEDVKLLLEMTTKLHESRKSEGSDCNAQIESPQESKPSGTADKPYVCSKCNRCFARESALVSHSQVHAEDSSHNCDKCGSRFFTIELLKEHYSKKHQSSFVEETIDEAENKKGDKGSYTGDERFGVFYCEFCSLSFHRTELLKQHKRTVHPRQDEYAGLYRCGTCHSMFLTNEKLLEHLRSSANCHHHMCLICGEQFSDQSAVESHIKEKHGRNLPQFTCSLCGKNCRAQKALKKHMLGHLPNMYSCKHCPKKFHDWNKLTRHMAIHTQPKSVACDECDEEYPDSGSLVNHRNRHHGSSSRKFFCNECGKGFGSRSSQQIHNRIHTGERPYGCRYCWKAFADGGTLRKHERIHTGEKPYVCAVCPRAFNQRVVLREHIRSHHSGSVNKLGYSNPVYLCMVCGASASGSEDLALHLVKHSDENTLRNRNAPPGVRHYKRRKKSETRYSSEEFEEADFLAIGSETESIESERHIDIRKVSRNRLRNNRTVKAVEPPPPVIRKAKMINTALRTFESKPGKKGARKRGKRVETSITVIETTKTSADNTLHDKTMGRPRTKNVNYETLRALRGLPHARFPENVEDVIKEEPVVSKEEIKEEVEEEEIATNEHHCCICNVMCTSKADLLLHVQVHI